MRWRRRPTVAFPQLAFGSVLESTERPPWNQGTDRLALHMPAHALNGSGPSIQRSHTGPSTAAIAGLRRESRLTIRRIPTGIITKQPIVIVINQIAAIVVSQRTKDDCQSGGSSES